jgi:hypothetical protein
MSRPFKLSDIHLILLSTASERDSGAVLPAAPSIAGQQPQISKAVAQLLKHRLLEEIPAVVNEPVWREEGDDRLGLVITAAGRTAIGIEVANGEKGEGQKADGSASGVALSPRADSKSAIVIGLLQREQGATLSELVEATGWLSHTTRAALTGLRKKGHVIDKFKRDDTTCYRIAAVA